MSNKSAKYQALIATATGLGRNAHDRGAREDCSRDKNYHRFVETIPGKRALLTVDEYLSIYRDVRYAWLAGWNNGQAALPHCKCCGQLLPK